MSGKLFSIKTLLIFVLISFLLLSLACVCFVVWIMYSGGAFNKEDSYQPKFKKSSFELITGEGFNNPHLYYKTSEIFSVGDKVESIKLISVNADSGSEASGPKKFQIEYSDNSVDKVGPGYIVFILDWTNFDCFAVYRNKEWMRFEYKAFDRLPTPSDAWMCKGFDFKNAFEKHL